MIVLKKRPRRTPMTSQLVVRVDDALYDRIDARCKREGRTMGDELRRLITRALDDADAGERRAKPRKTTTAAAQSRSTAAA